MSMNNAAILADCINDFILDHAKSDDDAIKYMAMVNDLSDLADPNADLLRIMQKEAEE